MRQSQITLVRGAGAIAGSLIVAWLGHFKHMGAALLAVQIAFGLLMAVFATTEMLWVAYALLFLINVGLMVLVSISMSLVQLIAPNQMRGRVMSIYMVAFRGGMPLGSLVSGKVADMTSAPVALAIDGVLLVLVGVYFLVRSHGVRDVEGASRAPQAPVQPAGATASGT